MNISYKWILDNVDIDVSYEELAKELTLAGLEVELITPLADANNLVIGQVLSVEPHPDAKTLNVAQVDIASETLQIVCGADNLALDQKVIVAKVGANVNGLAIKAAEIRGVASNGMICSLSELGVNPKTLSEEQLNGIEVLAEDAVVGNEEVLAYLGLDDILIDVDLTPNRSDCMAMNNLAHEVAAIFDSKVKLEKINDNSQGAKSNLVVKTETVNSPQILGKVINSVTVKPSVDWMVQVLKVHNMQAINNIVDISNIVMLETGQPLHFYDIAELDKLELIVKDGYTTKFTALNEEEYQINPEDMLITSNDKIVGIAGIMGGQDSKISDSTQGIVIEAAQFDLARIRKSARNLNIVSEAASRFSKGIDPNAIYYAMDRAVDLLIKYADASGIEENVAANDNKAQNKIIETSTAYINNRLGLELSEAEIVHYFERLDFAPEIKADKIVVSVPTYRLDIVEQVDLTEEVIRLVGVDSLAATLPMVRMAPNLKTKRAKEKDQVIAALLGSGFSESITYSLVSDKHLENAVMSIGEPVKLSNPISQDRKYYRTSTLASLLDVIAYNEARNNNEYSLYEIANVYSDNGESQERLSLGQSLVQKRSVWENLVDVENFFSLKGNITVILAKLGISENRISLSAIEAEDNIFHPYQSARVYIDRKLFGVLGKTHPNTDSDYDIKTALVGEFNLDVLYAAKKSRVKYVEIPKYPGVSRDIALIVDENLSSEDLIKTIEKVGRPLVKSAGVFDVYQGANIAENSKSLAIHIEFLSLEKTLTDDDVKVVYDKIVDKLIEEFNVTYRK